MHDELLAELRSLTQRSPSRETWDAIIALIRPIEGDALERFFIELTPYLNGALSHWPDVLRIAHPLDDPAHVFSVSRVLELDARQWGTSTGQRRIRRSAKLWAAPCCDHIVGVHLRGLSSNLDLIFHSLVTSLRNLERVYFSGHISTATRAQQNIPATASDYIDLLITHHASTLSYVGIGDVFNTSHINTSRAAWDHLFDRVDALPELRALCVDYGRSQQRIIERLLAEPHLDDLEELTVVSRSRSRAILEIIERAASSNLKRVRINTISGGDSQRLISSPNLSNVTCWELDHKYDSELFSWGSERSRYIATLSPFIDTNAHDILDTRWLDLSRYELKELPKILFDDEGTLHRLERVEGIVFPMVQYKDLDAFIKQAHERLPNLRKLVFDLSMILRPADIHALSRSRITEQLDLFWSHPTYKITYNDRLPGGRHMDENRRKWLEVALDARIHLPLRLHTWRRATFGNDVRSLRSTVKALGVTTTSRLNASRLREIVRAHTPEDFDHPDARALDGGVPAVLDPSGAITRWRHANPAPDAV